VLLVLVPLVVAFVATLADLGGDHRTMGDTALLELGVRRLGRDPLLLGPYSRFGWDHPGPAAFAVLAVPYALTGGSGLGLVLGALLVNAAAVVGILVLAFRRGGAPLLVWAAVLAACFLRLLGSDLLRDPWNPHLVVLPLALLVLLCWSVAAGDVWLLPVAVGVGSAAVQTHVGNALAVAALLVVATTLLLASRRSGLLRPLLATAAVAAVLWAPAVLEEARHDPGNLSAIRTYLEGDRDTPGLRTGTDVAGAQLGRLLAWTAGDEPSVRPGDLAPTAPRWPVAAGAGALVVTVGVAAWRRSADAVRLAALVAAFAGAAVVAAANVDGPVYEYLVAWIAGGGLALWLAVGAAVLAPGRRAAARRGTVRRWGAGMALAATTGLVVVLSATGAGDAAGAEVPEASRSSVVTALTAPLDRALGPARCPVRVRFSGDGGWAWGAGVVLDLEKAGRDVRVDREWQVMFGDRATKDVPAAAPTLTVAGPGGSGNGRVVAASDTVRVSLTGGCGAS